MSEVNQCDLYCPRRARWSAGYREDSANLSPDNAFNLMIVVGSAGVAQAARAASCPVRDNSPEGWQPNEECVEFVKDVLSSSPLAREDLSPHEEKVLGPIIDSLADE